MPQKFQQLKNSKKFSKSSQQWLLRQINDEFVEKAKRDGFRSRAVYKIIEIDEKFKIFKKNKIVVDLGAAPGGWSQYCVNKVGDNNVIAIDLIAMESVAGVNFIQLDFLKNDAHEIIKNQLNKIKYGHGKCDVVMSDMAANTTGDKNTDHLRIISLLEESLNLAFEILRKDGCFVGKIFQGAGSDEILKILRNNFSNVKYFKPKSSRQDSAETYLVATGFCQNNSN